MLIFQFLYLCESILTVKPSASPKCLPCYKYSNACIVFSPFQFSDHCTGSLSVFYFFVFLIEHCFICQILYMHKKYKILRKERLKTSPPYVNNDNLARTTPPFSPFLLTSCSPCCHCSLKESLSHGQQWPVALLLHDGNWGLEQLGLGVEFGDLLIFHKVLPQLFCLLL